MSQVAVVGEGNFQTEVVQANVPVVVDFWADWCQPCKMLSPVLDRLAARYDGRLKVVKCNVDENHAIAGMFAISTLPNLLFFKDGQVINQAVGYRGEEQLAQTIDEVLAA
ncbi:thioredoxin [bacterium]|nr:MAG: thioredoxin [bacterium]